MGFWEAAAVQAIGRQAVSDSTAPDRARPTCLAESEEEGPRASADSQGADADKVAISPQGVLPRTTVARKSAVRTRAS